MSKSTRLVPRRHDEGWPARLFAKLALACDRGGVWIVGIAVVAGAVSALYTWRHLGFTTDRNEVLATAQRYHQNYLSLKQEFAVDEELVVVVSGPRPELNQQAVDFLAAVLRADRVAFSLVMDKIDLDFVRQRLLLYLPVESLQALEKRLRSFAQVLARVLQSPGLVPLFAAIDAELQAEVNKAVIKVMQGKRARIDRTRTRQMGQALPVLDKLIDAMTSSLDEAHTYHSLWASLVPPPSSARGAPERASDAPPLDDVPKSKYFTIGNGSIYLLMVVPQLDVSSPNPTGERIATLEKHLDRARKTFPDVAFGLTGKPALDNDELGIAMADSERATVVAFVAVVLLFLLTFRHLARPVLAVFCLLLALSWTMGFTTLVIGRLNILTVNAMPMLVGLGIDFGIQVVCRYGEERGRGRDPLDAMTATMAGTGSSIVAAGITTSASFYAAYLTEFKGFRELALLSGTGLIFCLICMITVYPALLLMVERSEMGRGETGRADRGAPLTALSTVEGPLLRHPWLFVSLGAISMIFSVVAARGLTFDANVLHLQAPRTTALMWERRVYHASGNGLLYAAVVAEDMEQARALQARIERLTTVASVTSPTLLIPEDQTEKIPIIRRIHRQVAALPPIRAPLPDVDVPRLRGILANLRQLFLLIFPEARKQGGGTVYRDVRAFVFSLDFLLQRLAQIEPPVASQRLGSYQQSLFRDLAEKLELLRGVDSVSPVEIEDIPPGVRSYMISRSGHVLLRVFPREDVWDEAPMRRFLDSLSTVYPSERLTGSAVQVHMATIAVRRSCEQAGLYALIVIVATLLLHFRSVFLAVLAMAPLALGLLWTGGLMAVFGIELNPANYMALPLILGIGVANGVYVVRRFQEEASPALFTVSTGRAIILSNVTSIFGFGSLMIARHVGMQSLGLVMSLGVAMCAIASLTVLSSLLKVLQDRKVL